MWITWISASETGLPVMGNFLYVLLLKNQKELNSKCNLDKIEVERQTCWAASCGSQAADT